MKYINDNNFKNLKLIYEPYEHIIIDNFINENYMEELLGELDNLTIDKSYYYGNQNFEKYKFAFRGHLGNILNNIFIELNGDEFISILENVFNIKNIIRNNLELEGAGVHKVMNSGFLSMHTDFEAYNDKLYGLLDRRLNILIYMNPDWKLDYGGELCLYDKKTLQITKKVFPLLNRCIIFMTPNNIHGHPSIKYSQ